jgi:hypothetical protein
VVTVTESVSAGTGGSDFCEREQRSHAVRPVGRQIIYGHVRRLSAQRVECGTQA